MTQASQEHKYNIHGANSIGDFGPAARILNDTGNGPGTAPAKIILTNNVPDGGHLYISITTSSFGTPGVGVDLGGLATVNPNGTGYWTPKEFGTLITFGIGFINDISYSLSSDDDGVYWFQADIADEFIKIESMSYDLPA